MKIADKGKGCPMCRRIPVLSNEELQQLQDGKFLHGLVENAHGVSEPDGNHSAVDTMNSILDNLEALFGFGSAPTDANQNQMSKVTEEDLKTDQIIYCHNDIFYLRGKRQDYTVMYCPFCGNRLS